MISEKLERLKNQHKLRERPVVYARLDNHVDCHQQLKKDFSSSDYLGIYQHPAIKKTYKNAIDKYGFGSLASPVISGYYACHQALEEKLCDYTGKEKTLLFNAGFLANLAALSSLVTKDDLILADKLCHTSLLQGIKLSGARLTRYRHNDMNNLEYSLQKQIPAYVLTESVFSMDGDIANLSAIAQLAKKYQTKYIIDDAHGFGWLSHKQKEVSEIFARASVITVSLSKALASSGGAVSGDKEYIDYILQMSRVYQYSTGLSPVIAEGALMALKVLEQETWRQTQLKENIQYFNAQAAKRGLTLVSDDQTPIRSLLFYTNQKSLEIYQKVSQKGFLIACIRPPSVPENTARLRITLNCNHDEKDISQLLDCINDSE